MEMNHGKFGFFISPLHVRDINQIMTWVNDPEVVRNFQHFDKVFTRKDEVAYVQRIQQSRNDFVFSIFRRSDGSYIGQGAINQISWENKLGRLSLFIKREYWGKGYAQIAIPLLLTFAFKKLRLHKVWLMVYASNQKAQHLYRKLGFRAEGRLREEYFWRRRYHDIIRMGILKKEFKSEDG